MLRTGKITGIDIKIGVVTITDTNGEEINFSIYKTSESLRINAYIWFDIELTTNGLEVVSITFFKVIRRVAASHKILLC